MSDRFILSMHIQKLGHTIQEIRERALFSILSKLEHGFVYDNDLARSREILSKLFEWFSFEPCTYQEEVLNLIERILKSETGLILINHYGEETIASEIRQIRSYVEPRLYHLVDELLLLPQSSNQVPVDVPPLQSDLPLSYRTQETDRPNVFSYTVESTATPIEGYIQRDSSREQQTGVQEQIYQNFEDLQVASPKNNNVEFSSINFTLKWQPLVAPDRHVIESVEQSLTNPTEPSALLHSCEFFIDVMLQDFPAEIFLQRPTIVLLFHDYLQSSTSSRLTNSILHCLYKLTKYITTRIYYYRDPCTHNSKEDISIEICSGKSSPVSHITTHSYIDNIGSHLPSFDPDKEDSSLLRAKQLTIPRYCLMTMLCLFEYICVKPTNLREDRVKKKRSQIGINLSLMLLDELINLLSLCLKSNAWDKQYVLETPQILQKFEEVLLKLADVLEHFRLEVMSNNFNKSDRAIHLHLLNNSTKLLLKLIPLNKADCILPRALKNALSSILLDSALARLFPNMHESILQFVKEFGGRFEIDSVTKYKEIQSLSKCFSAAIKLLREHKTLSFVTAVKLAKEGVPSLEYHKNLDFIAIIVSLWANKLPSHAKHNDILQTSTEITLNLLAYNDSDICEEMYKLCHKRVIATIGPKLNTSGTGAPGSQIIFLLHSSILIEICLYGINNENTQIQKYSNDIIAHILKCKILVSEDIWNHVVQALIPTLPILACYGDKHSSLGRSIVSILDPDAAKSLNIPLIEVLKGNLRLLFTDDALTREEAVSRLCWLMGLQKNSRDLLPRLNNLQDKTLSSVCQLTRIVDVNKPKPSEHFYQPSALFQVLELLNSENVEPVIRRSAMTQISVMLEDPLLHHTFLERNGIKLIVSVMSSALTENDYKDYIDCIIPAVSILKNVCLYSTAARQELCNDIDVYFYILRGLFMFCTEDRMKQDSAILLCLLLFHDFVLGTPAKIDLSLPYLVTEKLTLPITCNAHWRKSKNTLPSLATTLLSDKWCLSSLQIHWNSEWFGGFMELLKWDEVKYPEAHLCQFNEQLNLTNIDFLAFKNSCLDYCISECLTNIQNGTSHSTVIDTIGRLEGYVNLYASTKADIELCKKDLLKFPWEYSFSRFLNAPPANEEDTLLLTAVIKFLTVLVPLYAAKDEPMWIIAILKNPSHCLPNLLQVDSSPECELKTLHQELLNLIIVCICQEQQVSDLHSFDELSTSSWLHIIEIIADNLKFSDAQHFYNLAYLDSMLSCLVHLTASLGWSQSKANIVPKEPIPSLILGLCELVGAFHCGKGPSAADSLMGLSITRHVVLVLNHLLAEMQYFSVKSSETCFIGENAVEENILYTLSSLWLSRDVVLRAAILQLLAGLAVCPRAAIELVQETRNNKTGNGIWETVLIILIDHEEASIVRENAATLLGNLASHTNTSMNQVMLIGNLVPITAKKTNNAIHAVLSLLEEFKFYKELEVILSSLYVRSSFSIDNEDRMVDVDKSSSILQLADKGEFSYAYTKSIIPEFTVRSENSSNTKTNAINQIIIVTPSFLKAVTIFVHNLLILAEEEISSLLQEHGLIKLFFRALTIPPTKINNSKELSLYCDILEMNTAVCALLTKAVSNNHVCLGTVLHTRDCMNVMLSLLNPEIYHVNLPQLIYLRNKLWTEVFNLIAALLNGGLLKKRSSQVNSSVRAGEALMIVTSVLNECSHQPFLQTLCEAISYNSSSDLQQSALSSLTSLLCLENKSSTDQTKAVDYSSTCMSVQNMLDTVRTPRVSTEEEDVEEDAENIEPEYEDKEVKILWKRQSSKGSPKQMNILENAYFGKVSERINELNKKKTQCSRLYEERLNKNDQEPLMAGAELCRILLHLYDISNIKSRDGKLNKRKNVIVNTLTSILCVSQEAKKLALRNGLVEMLMQQFKELHVKLSLESVEYIRRISDKKRVNPILKELGSLVGLTTNFILGDESIKCATSANGFADIIHKVWIWLCVERPLLTDSLKMLCTYTTNCCVACQSLSLTSSVAGSGPRKVPSNLSLLHEIISLISKEMDFVSRTHDLTILELSFHLLHNSCAAVECRNILAKSNLLVCLSRLHPALTKKQKPWENVEHIWLEFLLTFTSYPEGQTSVAKCSDALELIMMLTYSAKSSNKKDALMVLRNIAFYYPNRPRLLNCDEFLNVLIAKLTNGSVEEKNLVATIMWTLTVNSQKAKIILKCAGLDVKLQEAIKQLSLSPEENMDPKIVNIMFHVLTSLKDGEKK